MPVRKILLINWRDPGHPEAGGAEFYLLEIFKRLVPENYEIHWVSPAFKNSGLNEEISGLKIRRIKGLAFLFPFTFFFYYQKFLKKEKFGLVVDNISKLPLLTPFYIKEPMMAIFHQFHFQIFFKELFWPLAFFCFLTELLIPFVYRKKKMVVVSESTREELLKFGFPRDHTFLINPAINRQEYQFDLSAKTSYPSCLYLGRLKKYKGIADLLQAWANIFEKFPHSRLEIVGCGNDLVRLKKIVRQLKIQKSVFFNGFLDNATKNKILTGSWLLVFPSWREGFGISALEAAASGTPVVGYRVPGLKEIIQDGKTGFLVEPKNISGLSEAISLLFSNESRREKMSLAARDFSLNFSWNKSADEIKEIIEKLLAKNV